jgi:hypothetical protein
MNLIVIFLVVFVFIYICSLLTNRCILDDISFYIIRLDHNEIVEYNWCLSSSCFYIRTNIFKKKPTNIVLIGNGEYGLTEVIPLYFQYSRNPKLDSSVCVILVQRLMLLIKLSILFCVTYNLSVQAWDILA